MTPAEELLEAARLMRGRAQAATPGPWRMKLRYDEAQVLQVRPDLAGSRFNEIASCDGWNEDSESGADQFNAVHIASWHPGVALAVADWLDDAHTDLDLHMQRVMNATEGNADWRAAEQRYWDGHPALAVARAYLGGAA